MKYEDETVTIETISSSFVLELNSIPDVTIATVQIMGRLWKVVFLRADGSIDEKIIKPSSMYLNDEEEKKINELGIDVLMMHEL
jgi:hypothetical protein